MIFATTLHRQYTHRVIEIFGTRQLRLIVITDAMVAAGLGPSRCTCFGGGSNLGTKTEVARKAERKGADF